MLRNDGKAHVVKSIMCEVTAETIKARRVDIGHIGSYPYDDGFEYVCDVPIEAAVSWLLAATGNSVNHLCYRAWSGKGYIIVDIEPTYVIALWNKQGIVKVVKKHI